MARRSTHTSEELRELIICATTELIELKGLAGLSAREIARRIEYSPGTIYNVFENLDALILAIEGRVLDELSDHLAEVGETGSPRKNVLMMAQAYLKFTHARPRLWNLLFEHHMASDTVVPDWYQTKIDTLMHRIETALTPLFPDGETASLKRSARALWAGVHGITSLSTAKKLTNVTTEAAGLLVDDLVRTYLDGLPNRRDMSATA